MPGPRRRGAVLAALSEIRVATSAAGVLDGLRRVILDGGASPGSAIPVGEVATVFGVSPIPVREALKTLVGEGLVVHRRNGGYFVAQLTVDELREIYFVRGILERAALTRSVQSATDADVAAAHDVHLSLLTAFDSDDSRSYHQLSRSFHRALAAPCGMHRLLNMFESTWNITEPFQLMRAATPDMRAALLTDHASMLAAMLDRDTDALLRTATVHHDRLESIIVDIAADLDVADIDTES